MTEKQTMTADSLIRDLEKLRARRCYECAAPICSHESLMSIAMGFKDTPRCLKCLSAALHRDATELRDYLFAYFHGRDCYREAWIWSNRAENVVAGSMPHCLWHSDEKPSTTPPLHHSSSVPHSPIPPFSHSAAWDAGDMGCGDLVLELRLRFQQMKAGEILKLTARDLGAPEDLPSWCRLTGHTLLGAEHPVYWIRKE